MPRLDALSRVTGMACPRMDMDMRESRRCGQGAGSPCMREQSLLRVTVACTECRAVSARVRVEEDDARHSCRVFGVLCGVTEWISAFL